MQKIIMLGTGHGFVFNCYNTCFVMQNGDKYFLIDTGGGANIIKNMQRTNIPLLNIHDIFISHCHTDHLLGLFWILKKLDAYVKNGQYKGKLNIYCNVEVADAIRHIYPCLFSKEKTELIANYMELIELYDGETINITGRDYTFLDLHSKGNMLFGFHTLLDNQKELVFLGDEPLKSELQHLVLNKAFVMHEAFCLDSEKHIFKPYEKNHSTVKSVCETLRNSNIENLILFHTEDTL